MGITEVEVALAAGNAVARDICLLACESGEPITECGLRRAACGLGGPCTAREIARAAWLSDEERRVLAAAEEAKGCLLEMWGSLCRAIARGFLAKASGRMLVSPRDLEEDLFQEACVCLVHAANRYDGSTRMSTFLGTVVPRRLLDRINASSGMASCPRSVGREDGRRVGLGLPVAGTAVTVMSGSFLGMDGDAFDSLLSDEGIHAVFEEAEELGLAAGVAPRRIMSAYLGDGLADEDRTRIRRAVRRKLGPHGAGRRRAASRTV